MRRIALLFFILMGSFAFSQNEPMSLGGLDFSYQSPQEYEIGPIRIIGADNFVHQ